jgi:hypothetical protein
VATGHDRNRTKGKKEKDKNILLLGMAKVGTLQKMTNIMQSSGPGECAGVCRSQSTRDSFLPGGCLRSGFLTVDQDEQESEGQGQVV